METGRERRTRVRNGVEGGKTGEKDGSVPRLFPEVSKDQIGWPASAVEEMGHRMRGETAFGADVHVGATNAM